jgi:hypothetical protein
MPYHVEVRQPRRHARVFNLAEEEMRRTVLEPWQLGEGIELAGRRWEPRDSRLRILEGAALGDVDLAYGQGWGRAERTARDVTHELLQSAQGTAVAVLPPSAETGEAAAALLRRLGLQPVGWAAVRRPILAWLSEPHRAGRLDIAAALLVCVPQPPPWWLLDAGMALGALGARAALVQIEGGLPSELLRDLDVLALAPGGEADLAPLAARLRRAGCAVGA